MMKARHAALFTGAAGLLLTAASLSTATPSTANAPVSIQVCDLFSAAEVADALNGSGLNVQVATGQPGFGSCRYALTGSGARSAMIDAAELASEPEAREQQRTLVAGLQGTRPLTGLGDEAVLVDGGPYGTYSVKYRSGRVVGQVNLRADGASLEAAVIGLAQRWTQKLAGRFVAQAATAAPAQAQARQQAPADEPRAGQERGKWVRVPDDAVLEEPRRSLPPLPPLRWPDSDSVARARGLVHAMKAPLLPAGVDPALHASRSLRALMEADTLFSSEALQLHDQQLESMTQRYRAGGSDRRGAMLFDPAHQGSIFDPYGFAAARFSGPHAADEPWLPTSPAAAKPVIVTAAPRPDWYRDQETIESGPSTVDGTTGSGRAVVTRYLEPWRKGMGVSIETLLSKSHAGVSATQSLRQHWEGSSDICPSAEGIVKGRGTYEVGVEVRGRKGDRTVSAHVRVTNTYTVTTRVNDDAIPVAMDVHHSVEVRETRVGSDEYDMHFITEAVQTNIDPGLTVSGDGRVQRKDGGSDDLLHLADLLSTELTREMVPIVVYMGTSQAEEYLMAAFEEWWGGSCLEVRSTRQPARERLRAGETSEFELEAYHYQDEAVVALPVEIRHPGDVSAGTVSPTLAAEGPARFTFTAPRGAAWNTWNGTEIVSHSTSRRGRANVPTQGPTFSRRIEQEYFSITARSRTHSDRLGDVYSVTFQVALVPDPAEPGSLRAVGTFEGSLVSHDVNCHDDYDIATTTEPIQGSVDDKPGGFVTEGSGSRSLHVMLTGRLPPREGFERNVGFLLVEGVELPASGTGKVTYRKTSPGGFTGVMQSCSGEVTSISEITISVFTSDR